MKCDNGFMKECCIHELAASRFKFAHQVPEVISITGFERKFPQDNIRPCFFISLDNDITYGEKFGAAGHRITKRHWCAAVGHRDSSFQILRVQKLAESNR